MATDEKSVDIYENCSYKVAGNSKVSFATKCKKIRDELYLVSLCDGFTCLAKNVSDEKVSCGNGLPNPNLNAIYKDLKKNKLVDQIVAVASEVCQNGVNPENLSKKIKNNKKFSYVKEKLGFSNEEKLSPIEYLNQEKVFLIPTENQSSEETIDSMVSGSNSCLKDVWNEMGISYLWTLDNKSKGYEVKAYNLKTKSWVKIETIYPYCE